MIGSKTGSYLLATFEGGGSVAPFITIARKLIARGHNVRIMSDEANRAEVESVGAEFIPWSDAPSRAGRGRDFEFVRDWETDDAFEGFCMMLDLQLVGRAADYAADIGRELNRRPADLAVINDMLFGAQLGCEARHQPFVVLACNVSPYPIIPGIPPFGPGLPPAESPADQALHAQICHDSLALFDTRLDGLNEARAQFGLGPLNRLVDQVTQGDKFLIATCEAFDFTPSKLPANVEYVGAQLDDNNWSRQWTSPFADDDQRPLVVVGFSTTFQDHALILQKVIDALSELPVRVVVTLGGSIRPDEVSAAANTAIVESAPHHVVMRDASLVVTHGGHGTLMKALVHNCPLLVMPHGRDQPDNAIRVTHRGAGLSLPLAADVETLRAALKRLLEEPTFAANATRLGGAIREEMAQERIEPVLEAYIKEKNLQAPASKHPSQSVEPADSGMPPAS